MDLKSLQSVPASLALTKKVLFFCFFFTVFTVCGSLLWLYVMAKNLKNNAYVLTKEGQVALVAHIDESDVDSYRRPEIFHHIKMFHTDFWEVDQFSYERSIDKALYLAGDSGKNLYKTLAAKGHFAKLSTENLSQKIEMDSIRIDDGQYPYSAVFYGKLRVLRTDQRVETLNQLKAGMVLYNVARTDANPHGLLIENYHLEMQPIVK